MSAEIALPRELMNSIFHHVQQSKNALGYLTQQAGVWASAHRIESSAQWQTQLSMLQGSSCAAILSGFYQGIEQADYQIEDLNWPLMTMSQLTYFVVNTATPGVLEIEAYRYQHDSWHGRTLALTSLT